ncbi:MAG TPA: hypothetical protein VJQ82_11675 [Terriglobales bacterium]|nr:hypothetical protein [Terriglobales bacterium]
MRKLAYALLACIALSSVATAQDPPDALSQHRFWDKPSQILFFSHVALEAADFGITHHNLNQGGKEMNPMGKTLCESGTLGQLVYFGGRTAGVAGVSYLLHRMGHHRLERAFLVVASYDSASGVRYSFTH